MSIKAMSFVWDNSPSKGGKLLVLLALADRANDDGICWPGVKELARKSRLGERQVERVLKELHTDGEIEYPPGKPSKQYPIRVRQNVGPTPTSTGDTDVEDLDTHVERISTPMSSSLKEEPPVDPSKEPSTRAREVADVWSTYLEATGKRGMTLNDKRRRIIENALKVAIGDSQEEKFAKVKAAVVGLTRSRHHRGENAEGKEYLDIRYALKGIKDESDDERIEKMAALATSQPPAASIGIEQARIDRRLEEVRAHRSSDGGFEPERAARARGELEAWGFRLVELDAPPWVRLEAAA